MGGGDANGDDERPLPALRVADKLESLRPGEVMYIGRDGRTIGRRTIRRRQIVSIGAIAAVCAYAIAVVPTFGIPYAGILGGWVAYRVRTLRKLNRVPRLLRADRLDEAEREVEVLEKGGWRQRTMAAYGRALIECRRGRVDDAIEATARCERLLVRPDRQLYAIYWGNQFLRASLLVERGRRDEAAPVIARAMAAPDGELYVTMKRELECLRAFVADRPDDVGTDDQLHDRVRAALRYNHTGMTVALLAWAYERRGDAEMCGHLCGEVASRCMHGPELIERAHPRVWAWLGPKLAALPAPDED